MSDNPAVKSPILIDVEKIESPRGSTYGMRLELLAALRTGDLVKVSTGHERFWLVVLRQENIEIFVGRVDNELVATEHHGLVAGDEIYFCPHNVWDVSRS